MSCPRNTQKDMEGDLNPGFGFRVFRVFRGLTV